MTAGTYVARTIEDLVAMVPFVLGFHPDDSVVVMTFGAPTGAFHARVDLPRSPEDVDDVVDTVCRAVRRNRVPTAAVLVYSDEPAPSRAMCAALVPALLRAGARVVDAVRVDGSCWWSVLDADPQPHHYDLSCHPFTAERVFHGQAVLRSRAELDGTLEAAEPGEVEAVARAAEKVLVEMPGNATGRRPSRAHARWLDERLQAAARDGELLSVDDAGRALVLVQHPEVRDIAWATIPRGTAEVHVAVWTDLVRRAPAHLRPSAAAVLGFLAWLSGDGALAWCAVDRCLAGDPAHVLGHRVAMLLQGAVPPGSWEPMDATEMPLLARPGRRAS